MASNRVNVTVRVRIVHQECDDWRARIIRRIAQLCGVEVIIPSPEYTDVAEKEADHGN